MKVVYNPVFKELAENKNSHLLTESVSIANKKILLNGLFDYDTKSVHFFINGIFLDSPETIENITILYSNLITGEEGIAFELSNLGGLSKENNLIKINNLNWLGNIDYCQDVDTQFLESNGGSDSSTMFKEDSKYILKDTLLDYLDYSYRMDDLNHFTTVFINEFGIRIY